TRNTKIANTSCNPTPQATTRPLIAPRLRESAKPIARINAIPKIPVSRWGIERAAPWGTGGTVGRGALFAEGCGARIAPCTEFQAKRGSVNTSKAHTNVTATAATVRRGDIREPPVRSEERRVGKE